MSKQKETTCVCVRVQRWTWSPLVFTSSTVVWQTYLRCFIWTTRWWDYSLPLLPPERPGLLQLCTFFRHLSRHAGLHLAGGPGDQEQDLPGDLPDVCREEQSRDQAGWRGSATEREQSKPGGCSEGHGLLKRNESIQTRGSPHCGWHVNELGMFSYTVIILNINASTIF